MALQECGAAAAVLVIEGGSHPHQATLHCQHSQSAVVNKVVLMHWHNSLPGLTMMVCSSRPIPYMCTVSDVSVTLHMCHGNGSQLIKSILTIQLLLDLWTSVCSP